MLPGLSERVTKSGIPVLRLHYSADPHKRAGTPEGDAWLHDALQGYPGGMNSPRWRKEFEIDYGALGGTKLVPLWELWKTNGKIVIPPFQPHGYRLYGTYDHGWRHKSSYHVHGINSDGEIMTLFEFWDSHVPYQAISRIVKGETVRLPPVGCQCKDHQGIRTFIGNPYAGQEIAKYADPSMWAEDQPQQDGTNRSMAHLFRKEGIHFIQGQRGGDTTMAEWLIGHYWLDPMKPLYRITTACPGLVFEIGQQRHKDFSERVAQNRSQPEELVDKDNDAWDSLKQFLLRFPPTPQLDKAKDKPNSFEWWRAMAQQVQSGEPVTASFVIPHTQRDLVG